MPGPADAPAAGLAGGAMTPLFLTERLQARHLGMAHVDAMVGHPGAQIGAAEGRIRARAAARQPDGTQTQLFHWPSGSAA